MTIGEKIKELRLSKGLTRAAADRLIDPKGTGVRFDRWELYGGMPGWYFSVILTEIFGITLDELYLDHPPIECTHIEADSLGERIRMHRELKDLTQSELAELIHSAQKTVSDWELCRFEPRMESVIKIADALGVSLEELAGRKGNE